MRSRVAWFLLALSPIVAMFGCKSRPARQTAVTPSPGASNRGRSAARRRVRCGGSGAVPPTTSTAQLPEGPILAIEAGKGVGPIRLGATVATIERLMTAPCEVKPPTLAGTSDAPSEFDLRKASPSASWSTVTTAQQVLMQRSTASLRFLQRRHPAGCRFWVCCRSRRERADGRAAERRESDDPERLRHHSARILSGFWSSNSTDTRMARNARGVIISKRKK